MYSQVIWMYFVSVTWVFLGSELKTLQRAHGWNYTPPPTINSFYIAVFPRSQNASQRMAVKLSPFLKIGKLRHVALKWLAQGHQTSKNQEQNQILLSPSAVPFRPYCQKHLHMYLSLSTSVVPIEVYGTCCYRELFPRHLYGGSCPHAQGLTDHHIWGGKEFSGRADWQRPCGFLFCFFLPSSAVWATGHLLMWTRVKGGFSVI